MRKKKKAESQTAVHTHTHTLIFTLIGIIIIVIVAGVILVNKTNLINGVQVKISELSVGNENDDENLESEDEESVAETLIEDGYYDEENKVTWHVEEDGSMCPIPDGYVGSEATGEDVINTGYVIYEGTDEVTDENVTTAKTSRNQYVWIPVDDPSEMYGTDSNGKKWGKLYNFATSSDNENYDELTGTYPLNWKEDDEIMEITIKVSDREPDVVKAYDTDSILASLDIDIDTTHDFLLQLESEFNNMIESVEKYGGFYIGRYETGNVSQGKANLVQGNTDISYITWYDSYKICKTLNENNENVKTGLIWGCQWDRTLMWLIESENKTIEDICDNSSGWGNYNNSKFEYINSNGIVSTKILGSSTRIPTGSTEYTKSNNIYDIAGNVNEWTATAYSNENRQPRGCSFYDTSSSTSLFKSYTRYNYIPYNNSNSALRLSSNALYKVILKIINNHKNGKLK